MRQYSIVTFGLTTVVVVLVMVLIFAVLRLASAAKGARHRLREHRSETAFLSIALQDAVSKLKAQEQAMTVRAAASEQLSSQIVESLTAGLLVVDAGGRIEILNPAGRRLLAVQGDVRGRDYQSALAVASQLFPLVAGALEHATSVSRRRIAVNHAGGVSHLAVSVSPLLVDGARPGAICLFSDVTLLHELEEQLRLKDALARVGELTAGIAHEFRNGLATIHGYSRLIRNEELPPAYRPYVDGIRQETDALGHVVTNFLKFARPDEVVFARVDLESIIRRAADNVLHELPAGTAVDVSGTFGEIEGDEVLLGQAFDNLIRNAAEACDSAGVTPSIQVRGDADATWCRVAVDDNGPGIPDDARTKVFQPFFTTRLRGTGLGLAIVQKIVVTHNGRVSAQPSAQGGASIQMTFPRSATYAEPATVDAVAIG